MRPRCLPIFLCILSATVLAGPAAAGKKKAKKILADGAESVLKGFKKESKLLRNEFSAALDGVDADLKAGTATLSTADDVFDALKALQLGMIEEIEEASTEFRLVMAAGLTELEDSTIPYEEMPKGFYYGDGGTADDLRRSMKKAIDKVYDGAGERVRATAKLFEKKLDIAVVFRFEPPTRYLEWLTNAGGSGSAFVPALLTIDIALAASNRLVPNDARIYLGGSGSQSDGAVNLNRATSSGGGSFTTVTAGGDDRWELTLTAQPEEPTQFKILHPGTSAGGQAVALSVR